MPTDAQTPLEVRPAPPEPTRLNRRAGVAAFMVLGLLMAAIVYGVSTRQGVNMRGKEEQTRAESATNSAREIASRIGSAVCGWACSFPLFHRLPEIAAQVKRLLVCVLQRVTSVMRLQRHAIRLDAFLFALQNVGHHQGQQCADCR